MFRSLSPGAIGVNVGSLAEGLQLAARHGFAGYHFGINEAAQLGVAQTADLADAAGVRLSAWGFPVNFRGSEADWQRDLEDLPTLAQVGRALGVRRTATWIMPCSDELTYEENFKFHADRLKPAAAILAGEGVHLGLEYIGPKTLWSSRKHPFAHTLEQMGELCRAIGPNAGFLLDAWHWYTAGEKVADLERLSPEQAVDVHVNDAPAKPREAQVDNVRTLPGETGVIDIAGFLGALKKIGYDGPVMVEPFSERVRQLPPEEACAATAAALQKVWRQAGL
ncbi:MAG: sugar phosphate isomerase/epimerase [Candidatus Handelsmanbacteria bacterium]|nr:sugar phosphate isomerase/epimerase [Candidatus Handelsmanbacteria bacterium]